MPTERRICEDPSCQTELHPNSKGPYCRVHHGQRVGRQSQMPDYVREQGTSRLREMYQTPEGRAKLQSSLKRHWSDKAVQASRGLSPLGKKIFKAARAQRLSIEKSVKLAKAVTEETA